MTNPEIEATLKTWANEFLFDWRSKGKLVHALTLDSNEEDKREGTLVHQDSCSDKAYWMVADIYLLEDGKYRVYVECAGYSQNYEKEGELVEHRDLPNLSVVLTFLRQYSGGNWGPNSSDELFTHIERRLKLKPYTFDFATYKGDTAELIKIINEFRTRYSRNS